MDKVQAALQNIKAAKERSDAWWKAQQPTIQKLNNDIKSAKNDWVKALAEHCLVIAGDATFYQLFADNKPHPKNDLTYTEALHEIEWQLGYILEDNYTIIATDDGVEYYFSLGSQPSKKLTAAAVKDVINAD